MDEALVLIVGAGPTGLVLALWLTRLGVRVRIVDKTAEPGTTSRAVAVQARTLEFYRQVDLAEAVVKSGVKVPAANLWVAGAKAARMPLERLGQGLSPFPYALTYPQDAHERLLIERLHAIGVEVERSKELLDFDQDPSGVRAVLRGADGRQENCEAWPMCATICDLRFTPFPGGRKCGTRGCAVQPAILSGRTGMSPSPIRKRTRHDYASIPPRSVLPFHLATYEAEKQSYGSCWEVRTLLADETS